VGVIKLNRNEKYEIGKKTQKMSGEGSIYLLRSGTSDHYKIGRTVDSAAKRRKTLKTGNPEPLHILHEWRVPDRHGEFETMLHMTYVSQRLHSADSTEFFAFPDKTEQQLIAEINAVYDEFSRRLEGPADADSEQAFDTCLDDVDDELQALLARHRMLHAEIKLKTMECEFIDRQIKHRIGGHAGFTLPGRERPLVSWKTMETKRFDQSAFAKSHPDLFATFQKVSTTRRFVVHD